MKSRPKSAVLLLNLAPLKIGGGCTVAMNFLESLAVVDCERTTLLFAVARRSPPHEYLRERGSFNYLVTPRNAVARTLFEMSVGSLWLWWNRVDVIYSMFGFAAYLTTRPHVAGSADSNIFYPEIDFWKGCGFVERCMRLAVDWFRKLALTLADTVVFENSALMLRGRSLFRLQHTVYIKPSTSRSEATETRMRREVGAWFTVIMVCGWQRNKGITLVPEIARAIAARGALVRFVLTVSDDSSPMAKEFQRDIVRTDTGDMVSLIGYQERDDLAALYSGSDAVLLLSRLESFSNTILEAWRYRRPLIISDEEWARAVCADGALYVSREDVDEIAERIIELARSPAKREMLVQNGSSLLRDYPTPRERARQEMALLHEIVARKGT